MLKQKLIEGSRFALSSDVATNQATMSSPPTISNKRSIQLPLELVQEILRPLSRKDLKKLRLVSKTLANIVTPLCFDSIFLSIDPLDLGKARNILKSFTPLIKTMVISPIRYANLGEEKYRECVQSLERPGHQITTRTHIDEHMKLGFKEYNGIQDRSSHRSAHYKMLRCLRVALETSPNLEKVVVTHRRRYTELTGLELAKFCSFEECEIPFEMHALLRLSPHQSCWGLPSPDVSYALSSIIMFSQPRMRELIMEPCDKPFIRFEVKIASAFEAPFTDTPRRDEINFRSGLSRLRVLASCDVTKFISNLTRLRLGIDISWMPKSPKTRMIPSILAHARELECLFLDGLTGYLNDPDDPDDPVVSSFRYMLHGCRFPKLRVFVLGNSAMHGDELLPFLTSSPLLKRLVIDDCCLSHQRWEHLIEGIKLNTRLDDLFMDVLWEAFFGSEDWVYVHYADCAGDINDFIFHDRPNPFSGGKRKQYKDMWWSNRRFREPSMRVKEYYEKYF